MITEMLNGDAEAAARLVRIESMLAYMMGTTELEITTTPSTEQAKQLHALGLPPWPRITRKTNKYEIWKEGFEARIARQQDGQTPGDDNGQADASR